jgi:hypothetical protein
LGGAEDVDLKGSANFTCNMKMTFGYQLLPEGDIDKTNLNK